MSAHSTKRKLLLKWDRSKRILPFIGAKDYQKSRRFYSEPGFQVGEGEEHCEVKVNDELGLLASEILSQGMGPYFNDFSGGTGY